MNDLKFNDLSLSEEMLRAVEEMGYTEPTPIQAQSIPHLIEGRDLLGQAQTGTGKTSAFGIPLIEHTDTENRAIQHLILAPTRELAMQIAEELDELARYKKGVRTLAIYGGQSMERQLAALRRHPQIIVGTPGRVMDHMRRKTIRLAELESIVLDEADEMLNMGFREDIDTILTDTKAGAQRVLFSATMPRGILEIAETYLEDPIHVEIKSKTTTVSSIDQTYIEVREATKAEVLCRLIEAGNIRLALVFCKTKNRVDDLTAELQNRGYQAEGLHGDMNQRQRTTVMNAFKQGRSKILIATDVAARGIDVDDIELVINYDIPYDVEYYIHRIGRTGRAGKSGQSVSFVVGRELLDIRRIAKLTKSEIRPASVPSIQTIQETRMQTVLQRAVRYLNNENTSAAEQVNALEATLEELNRESDREQPYTMADLAAAFLGQELEQHSSFTKEIQPLLSYDEVLKRKNPRGEARSKYSSDQNGRSRGRTARKPKHQGEYQANRNKKHKPAHQDNYRPGQKASYAGDFADSIFKETKSDPVRTHDGNDGARQGRKSYGGYPSKSRKPKPGNREHAYAGSKPPKKQR